MCIYLCVFSHLCYLMYFKTLWPPLQVAWARSACQEDQEQKAHRQKQNAEAQRRHQEKKKGGPLRNKAPDGYRKLTLEQQIAHPSGFYYTELEHASVKKEAVPPSPAVPKVRVRATACSQ